MSSLSPSPAHPPQLPPGPRGRAAFRTLLTFSATPTLQFAALRDQWGDVMSMPAAGQMAVLLSDPALIGEVLLDKEGIYEKDVITAALSAVLGRGLLTSEGLLWRTQRKLVAPSLTKKHVAAYADAMVARTLAYVAACSGDAPRDVHADMSRLTLEIAVETLFGAELAQAEARIAVELDAFMQSFVSLVQTWRRIFPAWVPFAARRRMKRASDVLTDVVRELVAKKRASDPEQLGGDLLTRLLAARGDDGKPMSDGQLRDEVVTLMLAGHETTANALSFALYLFAHHPEVVAKLREESARVYGERPPRADDLPKLTYAEATLREVMRLYPPAYMIGRKPTREVILGGHRIPKNAQVLISPWSLHRDPRFFEAPEQFRPERWLEGLSDKLPKNVYLPFGGGPRVCVGNHFAMMEGTLMVSLLASRLSFAPTNTTKLDLMAAVTLRPRDELTLRVRLP